MGASKWGVGEQAPDTDPRQPPRHSHGRPGQTCTQVKFRPVPACGPLQRGFPPHKPAGPCPLICQNLGFMTFYMDPEAFENTIHSMLTCSAFADFLQAEFRHTCEGVHPWYKETSCFTLVPTHFTVSDPLETLQMNQAGLLLDVIFDFSLFSTILQSVWHPLDTSSTAHYSWEEIRVQHTNLDGSIPGCRGRANPQKPPWSVTRTSILKVLDFMFGGLQW